MSATYIYGVVSDTASLPERPGLGGEPLELVADAGLAALVSSVSATGLVVGREALETHARVLEAVHAEATVLPMRFGVVMADRAHVVSDLLEPHRESLRDQLASFEGTVELKLRATYEEQPVLEEIVREDQDIARLRDSLKGRSPDATYYGQIRLGELVAQALQRKRDGDAAEVLDRLEPLALASEVAEPPDERVVLVASFLVARARMGEFDAAVDRVGQAQRGRMRFVYTGPLPPHSFVTLSQEV